MSVYTLYIDDDRYSVPTIDILWAETDEEARALAAERLASSAHHLSIAVWNEDRLVCETPSEEQDR